MNVASFLKVFAVIAWVAFFGMLALVVLRASRSKNVKGVLTGMLVVLVGALVLTSVGAGVVFIQPEERGVVISALQSTGYRSQPLQPGLRWIIPFFESVVRYTPSGIT